VITKPSFVAFATVFLLHSGVAYAQPETGVREYRFPNVEQRTPVTGFTFGMRPGQGNSYTYPFVESIVPGSAAEAAGLMVGDTIISVDGRDMLHGQLFPVKVPGTRYVMLVRRGSEEMEIVYTYPQVEQAPKREDAAAAPPE
jgi:S1-C subfamily serine protease